MPEKKANRVLQTLSRMLRSLRNPNYRIYALCSLAQFASLNMQVITGPLLIYRLTESPALLGLMSLVGSIPMIIMAVFGGAIADRISKKKVVIISLIGSALVALIIGLLLASDIISKERTNSWLILFGAMICSGGLNGMLMPALQALIPEIVERDELMNAVAFNSLGVNALNLIAPAAAGFMIDAFDFHVIYFTISGLYAVALIFILFVRSPGKPSIAGGSLLGEIQNGLRYFQRDKVIMTVLAFTLVVTLLSSPYQQLMPIFTDDILKVGATGLGLLMSVSGAGAVVTSLLLMGLPDKRRGLLMLAGGVVSGLALVGFSFSSVMQLSIPVMVFIGIGQTIRVTLGSTLLQANTNPEYLGRIMSLFHVQWGLTSVFTFVAGGLSEVVPVQWVLGTMAMILIAVSILAIFFMPTLRKLD